MPDYSTQIVDLNTIIAAAMAAKARYERGLVAAPQDDIRLLNATGNLFSAYGLDDETSKVVRDICIDNDLDPDTYEPTKADDLTDDYDDDRESWIERRSTYGMGAAA